MFNKRGQNKIDKKLRMWFIASCTVLLLLISICLFAFEFHQLKNRGVEKLQALTEVLGANSTAAISFDDHEAANEVLNALTHQQDVQAAFILDKKGEIFAEFGSYGEQDKDRYQNYRMHLLESDSFQEGYDFGAYGLHVFAPIMLGDDVIGTIHAFDSLGYMHEAIVAWFLVTLVALLSLVALAYALSIKLSQWLTTPIIDLKNTMQTVSRNKNYNTEVSLDTNDEISDLYKEFNTMLKEIKTRDLALESQNKALENEVQVRTQEIHIANEQLQKYIMQSQEARTRAEELAKAKSAFLANMSHEIRTPLNGIVGIIEIMSKTELNPKQKEYIHIAQMSSETLLQLVNDVLDFSKIESGQFELELREINIHNLMESLTIQFMSSAIQKGVRLFCKVKPQLIQSYFADELRLKQIFSNLLSNAIKFTHEGEITVSWDAIQPIDEHEDRLYFSVSDTGKGIARESLNKIFEAFSQEDHSTTRKYGGTGLGLNICKHIVELMDGLLYVKSELGKGSTFYFELTLKRVPVSEKPLMFEGLKLLIFENHASEDALLRHTLEQLGIQHDNLPYYNLDALVLDSIKDYDLILCETDFDTSLTDSLFDLIQSQQLPPPPILMLGSLDVKYAERLKKGRLIEDYLLRPVTLSFLIKKIAHICLDQPMITEDNSKTVNSQLISKNNSILVAEDNEVNQKIIKIILERLGFQVSIANNGQEALEVFKSKKIDFVFMDCQMPEMDGFEASESIRSLDNGKHVPIVALTGNVTQEDRKACFDAQMNDFITKPFSEADLIKVLNKWLMKDLPAPKTQEMLDTDSPILVDINRFKQVMDLGDNSQFSNEIIQQFNTTTQKQLNRIKTELESKHFSEVQSICHRLKSSCASLGAQSMSELCATIESLIKKDQLESIDTLCEQLELDFALTAQKFETLRRSYEQN